MHFIFIGFADDCLNYKPSVTDRLDISEVIYESIPMKESETVTKRIFQSLKKDQVPLSSCLLPVDKDNNEMSTTSTIDMDIPQAYRIPSILLHSDK